MRMRMRLRYQTTHNGFIITTKKVYTVTTCSCNEFSTSLLSYFKPKDGWPSQPQGPLVAVHSFECNCSSKLRGCEGYTGEQETRAIQEVSKKTDNCDCTKLKLVHCLIGTAQVSELISGSMLHAMVVLQQLAFFQGNSTRDPQNTAVISRLSPAPPISTLSTPC